MWAKDVVSFAREAGLYEGTDEEFSFCDTYAPADFSALRACEARVWAAFNILGKGMFNDKKAEEYLDFAMGHNASNKMPLFIKPAQKVSAKELADVMRDHYEGTPMDMTTDIGAGGHHNPYRWRPMYFEVDGQQYLNERAIATQQTGFWYLCQSRSWLPDEVGGVIWFGVDDAATSCLTPVYTSVKSVPECVAQGNGNMITYSPTSLFWLTNRVAHMAYLMYDRVAPDIQAVADKFENDCIAEQAEIDAKALQIMESASDKEEASAKVREYLTAYSKQKAQQLFNTWQGLDSYFLVKYRDGNVKRQNEDGSFKSNGNKASIPDSPVQPGYSQKWKEAVVKDAGEVLKVK
jgi:dipeptidase